MGCVQILEEDMMVYNRYKNKHHKHNAFKCVWSPSIPGQKPAPIKTFKDMTEEEQEKIRQRYNL